MLSDKIKNADASYFGDLMEFENLGFIVDVSLSYDFEASLHHSIDLGMLPFLKRVALDELSKEQMADASHLRRNINTESARMALVFFFSLPEEGRGLTPVEI